MDEHAVFQRYSHDLVVFRAYLFGCARISAFSELIQYRRTGLTAEKSISDFSDSFGELRLAELALKARFLRLFVREHQNKRVFRAYSARTRTVRSTEKSIFGFSGATDELRLAELALKARFLRLFVRELQKSAFSVLIHYGHAGLSSEMAPKSRKSKL